MHHCLCISEILSLIFEFVGSRDNEVHLDNLLGKRSLASLARSCHLFSSPALDILWRNLHSLDPLLKLLPAATSVDDDIQWSNFRQYAKRVMAIHGRETRLVQVRQGVISSLQHYPRAYFPLLPNVTVLGWNEVSLATPQSSSISLLKYLAGAAVTTISLSLMRWSAYSPAELAVLEDLPRLCPNVTSLTVSLRFSWDYDPAEEVGAIVTQWPRLRALRACAIPQSAMDHLFARPTLETLGIEYHKSSPVYIGRIPNTVREFSLAADCPSLCKRFFETVHASPVKVSLLIGMNEEKEELGVEETFSLLPRSLDPSCLQSLTIQPCSTIFGIRMWNNMQLRGAHVSSALVAFTELRELDLDMLSTAHVSDAEFASMAASLMRLRSLKLGTAISSASVNRDRPKASVGAVVAVVTHCRELEKLHVVFDGSVLPPGGAFPGGGETACNGRITTLRVGYSPIVEATVVPIAHCLRTMMPCLVQIEHADRNENWWVVQRLLEVE